MIPRRIVLTLCASSCAAVSAAVVNAGAFVPPPSSAGSFVGAAGSRSLRPPAPPVAATSRRQRRRGASSPGLSMHLGHSHSHHHHHDHGHDHNHGSGAAAVAAKPPKTRLGKALFFTRRRPVRVVFAALAILVPALVRRGRISRAEFAAFAMTSAVLSVLDGVRTEGKRALDRIKKLKEGWDRHAPTLEELNPRRMYAENDADRVTLLGVLVNLFLSVGKATVGITCHSSALVADAGHSLSDLFSDFITLWAVQIGRLPPDEDHPYGHGKFEAVGSLFLALTLLATGLGVGASSNAKLFEILQAQKSAGFAAAAAAVDIPTFPALLMAGMSILSKEWLFRITRVVGERLNSQVVIANAWHHRSDAYSSVLALISIGLAMAVPGLLAADAAAGMLVAGMICMTGAEILGESIKQLTDTNDEDIVERVTNLLSTDGGGEGHDVKAIKHVRARQVGSQAVVDVSVQTPAGMSASACRAVEERLRWRIMDEPGVIDAEVRAASEEVVCPLLAAEAARKKGFIAHPPSAVDVEDEARKILEDHPRVDSVGDVIVHYQDTVLLNVHAMITIDDKDTTVADASGLAKELRERLEEEESIHRAGIFLDLNGGAKKEELDGVAGRDASIEHGAEERGMAANATFA